MTSFAGCHPLLANEPFERSITHYNWASVAAACTCRSGSIDPKTSSAIDCRELLGGRAQCLAWRRRRGTSTKGQLLATVTHCSQLSPAFHRISVFVKARRNGTKLRCLLSLVTMAATAALWLMETDPAPRICLRHSFSSADEVCSTTASDGVLFLTGPSTFPGSSKIPSGAQVFKVSVSVAVVLGHLFDKRPR